MKNVAAAGIAAACLAAAWNAQATTARYYQLSMDATLISELGYGPTPTNSGVDQHMKVGDQIHFATTIDIHQSANWAGTGIYYDQWGTLTGPDGLFWTASDDWSDGEPVYQYIVDVDLPGWTKETRSWSNPGVFFDAHHIYGLTGWLMPALTSRAPEIRFGGAGGGGTVIWNEGSIIHRDENGFRPGFDPLFQILPPDGDYDNFYGTQGFQARWDLENAKILRFDENWNPVPEPATWSLIIAGFGLVGAALRRRRQVLA